MVLKVTAQPEADMLRVACDFKFPESELVKRDAFGEGASIWKCATHTPGGIVYWVGPEKDGDVEFFAYLALMPTWLGDLSVLEAKKGWTEDVWRRKGLGTTLLKTAAETAAVLSDSDGMTAMAFAQWESASGLKRRWWDVLHECFVDDLAVPSADRFSSFEDSKRWLMVLDLTS